MIRIGRSVAAAALLCMLGVSGAHADQKHKLPNNVVFTAYDTGTAGFNTVVVVGKMLDDKHKITTREIPKDAVSDMQGATRSMAKDPFLPVDDEARGLAKKLMRTLRSGALATNDAESGMPFASLVQVGTDLDGAPVILTSQLSVHTQLLEADPHCSLLLSSLGKGDPLAHPRLTLLATAHKLERDNSETQQIRRRYLLQHPKAELYVDFPDFAFWRLAVVSGSLNGGFGRAYRMAKEDLLADLSGFFDFYDFEAQAVEHMNDDHADAVALYATQLCGAREGAWRLIGIDPEGVQMALGDEILRLPFPRALTGPHEVRPMLIRLANEARGRIS